MIIFSFMLKLYKGNFLIKCILFFIEQFKEKCIHTIQEEIIDMLYSSFMLISNEFHDTLNVVVFNHRNLPGTAAA